jgi:hypothetical protein
VTFEEARDVIFEHFQTEWDAKSGAIVEASEPVEVFYENLDEPDREPDGDFYAKVSLNDTFAQDAVLGGTLYDREAILRVEIYTPGGVGLAANDRLAQLVVERFRGQRVCSACFRRVRRVTIGATGSTYQTNVLVDVEYEDRK